MKRIFEKNRIEKALAESKYREMLERLPVELFLTEYEVGEFLPPPDKRNHLLQIVVEGSLSIYFIRDDGSSYALAISRKDELIGEMEFFGESRTDGIFAEVTQKLICMAFSTTANRSTLLNDAGLLSAIAESLIDTIKTITMQNAAPPSLQERAYSYMLYKCEGKQLKGVEKAAFQLHCSARQLQRILNAFVQDGVARKIGKGAYELC